ncbi:hypothetical protein I0600191H4_01110 [Collinsella sp. i06-0019-1H4]
MLSFLIASMVNLLSRTLTEKGMIANSSAIAVMPYVTIRVVLLLGMPPHRSNNPRCRMHYSALPAPGTIGLANGRCRPASGHIEQMGVLRSRA